MREALISLANIGETDVIEKDFLQDECGHSAGQLGSLFHDSQTKWNDLGGQ